MDEKALRDLGRELFKTAAQRKRLIAIGFEAHKHTVMSADASDINVHECRVAFYAGAMHLFNSTVCMFEARKAFTEDDLARVRSIFDELEEFAATLSAGADGKQQS